MASQSKLFHESQARNSLDLQDKGAMCLRNDNRSCILTFTYMCTHMHTYWHTCVHLHIYTESAVVIWSFGSTDDYPVFFWSTALSWLCHTCWFSEGERMCFRALQLVSFFEEMVHSAMWIHQSAAFSACINHLPQWDQARKWELTGRIQFGTC